MKKKNLLNRTPRGSEQRPKTKLSKDIPPSLIKWLRSEGASDPQIEIYFFVRFENKALRIVKNADVAAACNMHRATVKYHIRKMIDLGILDRNGLEEYTALNRP